MKNQAANNGTFIPKPGFTVVQNRVARDWNLSSGALGLYTRIQSYITMENITLTKGSLMERVPEGEYAFNTAWNELKSKGYLFIHVYPGEKGRFVYQYELRPDNSGWTDRWADRTRQRRRENQRDHQDAHGAYPIVRYTVKLRAVRRDFMRCAQPAVRRGHCARRRVSERNRRTAAALSAEIDPSLQIFR